MRYGLGGTHLMVVPFMNFRTPGVFLIMMVYGALVASAELRSRKMTVRTLLWYSMFFVTGPFWVWYGEMSLVRGIMAFYVVWIVYRTLPKRDTTLTRDHSMPLARAEAGA
jgi:hypothetical protein